MRSNDMPAARNSELLFDSTTSVGDNMKFCVKIHYKRHYKLCINSIYKSTITNSVKVRYCEVNDKLCTTSLVSGGLKIFCITNFPFAKLTSGLHLDIWCSISCPVPHFQKFNIFLLKLIANK